jgi:hypothetical protein
MEKLEFYINGENEIIPVKVKMTKKKEYHTR